MSAPKLSICIPTYNRATYLNECLDSIVAQFKDDDIYTKTEVIISDNASTDDTLNIVKKFTEKFDNIKYFKNEKNIGFDKNLLNVIEKSTGEYCLTLGDDDALFSNSLSIIFKKIDDFNFPYYILNCWGYNHEMTSPVVSHPNWDIKEDRIFNTLSDFVKTISKYIDIVGNFGGMSMQLFSRKAWADFSEKEKFIGTNTIHLFILLSIFKDSKFVLVASPCIKTRNDNMRWDTFPGLEANAKRSKATADTVLWISDLYGLSLSSMRVKGYFLSRVYWISLKEFVKSILHKLNLRK